MHHRWSQISEKGIKGSKVKFHNLCCSGIVDCWVSVICGISHCYPRAQTWISLWKILDYCWSEIIATNIIICFQDELGFKIFWLWNVFRNPTNHWVLNQSETFTRHKFPSHFPHIFAELFHKVFLLLTIPNYSNSKYITYEAVLRIIAHKLTFGNFNSYGASHNNWCTATLWNRIMTSQCEGMGEVGPARYEPALLPPCPSIRALCYSNCQRSTQSHQQSKG